MVDVLYADFRLHAVQPHRLKLEHNKGASGILRKGLVDSNRDFLAGFDLYNVTDIPYWFNGPPTLEHFRYLFEQTLFGRWLLNSLIIGVCVVGITLATAVPAGYALARLAGRSGEAVGIGIFLTYLVPPTLLFLPLSRVISMIGLQNSMWSLVLVYPTFTIPFCTWLLMGFFRTVPREIEEAAIIDGCSLFGSFVKTVLPLSLPAILTVIIFTFTLTLAGALIASIPVAIAYNFFLDGFIDGITSGAVK